MLPQTTRARRRAKVFPWQVTENVFTAECHITRRVDTDNCRTRYEFHRDANGKIKHFQSCEQAVQAVSRLNAEPINAAVAA